MIDIREFAHLSASLELWQTHTTKLRGQIERMEKLLEGYTPAQLGNAGAGANRRPTSEATREKLRQRRREQIARQKKASKAAGGGSKKAATAA
jgi:hypothetical protein